MGNAVAWAFAREGAHLFLTGRDVDALDALAEDLARTGTAVHPAQVDALDERAFTGTVANLTGGMIVD